MKKWNEAVFASARAMRMFPAVVWKAELDPAVHRRMNKRIHAILAQMRRTALPLKPGYGWQSGQALHELEEFRELTAIINAATASVLDYLRIGYNDFEITGCWANVNPPGASHGIHGHPNNFFSGVYYVRAPKGGDTINFHDPRIQTSILRPPVTELTADNADQVVVKVKDGTLLLFPSWLQHSVDTNRSDEERISVSFNIMFSAYTEKLSKPLWQGNAPVQRGKRPSP